MITVYFEAKAGSHIVAKFDSEETYMACFPALEQLAMLKGYTITESVNYEEGEKRMNREPHSKYPNGIVKWELRVTWDDGEVEVMANSLPESLRNEIEQHLVDLEDLRAQDPEGYFMENAG